MSFQRVKRQGKGLKRVENAFRPFRDANGAENPAPSDLLCRLLTELDEYTHQSTKKCMKDAGMSKKTAKKSRTVKDDGRKAASGMA
jgi:hypothetical protein